MTGKVNFPVTEDCVCRLDFFDYFGKIIAYLIVNLVNVYGFVLAVTVNYVAVNHGEHNVAALCGENKVRQHVEAGNKVRTVEVQGRPCCPF